MKNLTKIITIIITVWLAHTAQAEDNRFSYDLFGAYGTRDKDGGDGNAFGIGAGVNYFFTDNIGVGVDTYTDGIRFPYMLNASAIYRFATESMFNPYAFAGFGRQWKYAAQWTGHIGGGAEYKMKSGIGIFLDGRFVLAQETSDYGLLRVGVRLGF